jgi:hypothetical protein
VTRPPGSSLTSRSTTRTDDLRDALPASLSDPARPRVARALDDEYVRRGATRADDPEVRRLRRFTAAACPVVDEGDAS